MRVWNARYAGKPALNYKGNAGYFSGRILGKPYRAHRVAWAIFLGAWPESDIDHINGKRSDNRIANLRTATRQENGKNCAIGIKNTSGTIGVSWHSRDLVWTAQVNKNGKHKHIGSFKNKDEAIEARAKANLECGYHANHGRKP
jgi:hypothetical protein